MAFKKININRNEILNAIKTFDGDFSIETKEESSFLKYFIKKGSEVVSKINVYPTPDGKTTISWQECKNPEFSEEIATHIVDKCKFPEELNTSIYIKNLNTEKLNNLLEYLIDYCSASIESEKNLTNGKQYKVKSIYGDTVYLNHFTNNAFNVQGTNGLMKSQVIEGLSAYLDYSEVVEATLESYKIEDIDANGIQKLFNARLPEANSEISDTVKGIIFPVFVLERIKIDDELVSDYSFMVFPIFRGLEGCIKEIFFKFGINIGNNIGGQFQDHTNSGKFALIEKVKNQINNNVAELVLSKLYNYHKTNRHAIFHVDDTIITTRIIEDKKVAQSLINETFELIEMCYIAYKNNDVKFLK